ncbi:MAG: enoyl-CoA hydratase/isomerase family protein [Chloroflexi bacterium]|nr:enoyl-CoA hydratase/isomerase family protein [Chloroflexota bacterium]
METQEILWNVQERVATITINRPQAMNAFTNENLLQLTRLVRELGQRDDVGAIILRGAGDRAFSAGHDLKEAAELRHIGDRSGVSASFDLLEAVVQCPKPTIAAVRGYVRGGGNRLAAMCDIVIAAEDASFGVFQINFGAFSMDTLIGLLPRVGRSKAIDLILTADVVGAREAKEIGLVDRVVSGEQFEEVVRETARKIASRDPQAVKAGKEALWLLIDSDYCKAVRAMHNIALVYELQRDRGQDAARIEQHLTSVRGRGATQLKR